MGWTKEQTAKLIELYSQKTTIEEIASILDKTDGAIRNKAYRMGITNPNDYSEEEIAYVVENYKSYNLRDIAIHLGRPKTNLCRLVRQLGIDRTMAKKEMPICKTRIYSIYKNMIARCYYANHIEYRWYGKRGITVCQEWKDNSLAFYEWAIANGYSDSLTIDRIDVNGNYEPSNCRWITNSAQQLNKTNTAYVIYQGEKLPVKTVAEMTGIRYTELYWGYASAKKAGRKQITIGRYRTPIPCEMVGE